MWRGCAAAGPRKSTGCATSRQLASTAALRNRIAHGYASVDFPRIWQELPDDIAAFDAFLQEVSKHLGPEDRGSESI